MPQGDDAAGKAIESPPVRRKIERHQPARPFLGTVTPREDNYFTP
jgi:hypothetical protein